jgi:hypothetical protein
MSIRTVGDLRKALENVPDDMELVIGLFGNQHDPYEAGIAECGNDGIYFIPKDGTFRAGADKNFLIAG